MYINHKSHTRLHEVNKVEICKIRSKKYRRIKTVKFRFENAEKKIGLSHTMKIYVLFKHADNQ